MYLKARFWFFMFAQDNSEYEYIFGFLSCKGEGGYSMTE